MDLSVIIVSWNVRELLEKCLLSLGEYRGDIDLEIFVIDNASADGTVEKIRQQFPSVKLIASDVNLGFARANNLAIRQAVGEYVLLLNPDTEIFPDTLGKSLAFMSSHPDCGIMGPRMQFADGSPQPSVRRFPSLWPLLLLLFKLPKLWPQLKAINDYLAADFDYGRPQAVDQIMGAFMLIRREVIGKIGLMDERFFIWFEEVDFCLRCWQAGYKVYYNPDARIIHYGGQSFSQQKTMANQSRFFKSAFKYFLKNGVKKYNVKNFR